MVSRVSFNSKFLGLSELRAINENFGLHNRHFIPAVLLSKCHPHCLEDRVNLLQVEAGGSLG